MFGRITRKASQPAPIATANTTTRARLIVGLGTTGLRVAEYLRATEPRLRDVVLAMDGEVPEESGREHDSIIAIPEGDLATFLRKPLPIIRDDAWMQGLNFPNESHRGAGACRAAGLLKGAPKFATLAQRLRAVLHRELAVIEGAEHPRIDVDIVGAPGGGIGSALFIPAALIVRDVARRIAPNARCDIALHGILASNYEKAVANPDEMRKLVANDFVTFLELNYAQTAANVRAMARRLGLDDPSAPTFNAVHVYDVTDGAGRSYTLDQTILDRVPANLIARGDETVANKLRERASNQVMRLSSRDHEQARRIIAPSQATVVRIPPELGRCYATRMAAEDLARKATPPDEERVAALTRELKSSLGIETCRMKLGELAAGVLAKALVEPKQVRALKSPQAKAQLLATWERYGIAAKENFRVQRQQFFARCAAADVPEAMARVHEALGGKAESTGLVTATLDRLLAIIRDFAERARKEESRWAELGRAAHQRFLALHEKLSGGLLRGGTRADAALALNELIKADVEHGSAAVLARVAELYVKGLERARHHAEALDQAVVFESAQLALDEKRLVAQVTTQSGHVVSVIRPDEIEAVLDAAAREIAARLHEHPELGMGELLDGGAQAVGTGVDRMIARHAERFAAFYETKLGDLTGAVRTFGLGFSVEKFLDRAVKGLATSSAVAPAAEDIEDETILAASGKDLATACAIAARKASLKHLEIVEGADTRAIVMLRRVVGHTIEAVPTFHDGRRAAAASPKPGTPGVSAWESLASSGFLLGAYDADELTPASWHGPEAGRAPRRVPTAVNGDGE